MERRSSMLRQPLAFPILPYHVGSWKRRLRSSRNSKSVIFPIFIDTIHRGGDAFMVSLGIDEGGHKHALGFWQGATEHHEICEELLSDIQTRGLVLTQKVIWITDGGKGIIKVLRDRFGSKLLHQRCTIHKDRNIQRHLAKRYRKMAHKRFKTALEQNAYEDARRICLILKDGPVASTSRRRIP